MPPGRPSPEPESPSTLSTATSTAHASSLSVVCLSHGDGQSPWHPQECSDHEGLRIAADVSHSRKERKSPAWRRPRGTWSPKLTLSLLRDAGFTSCHSFFLRDVGMLNLPKETGMKVKAGDARRCLGMEPGTEDAPASRFFPGCSSSGPLCRGLPGPPHQAGWGLLLIPSSILVTQWSVVLVETCFREQTPGSGLF